MIPDIRLEPNVIGKLRVIPISAFGGYWLQTHFEPEYWDSLMAGEAFLCREDALQLYADATAAGVVVAVPVR